jgi:membrane-associated phospholipid phosphatase
MCHFKEDIFIGSILGIIAGILSVFIYEKGGKKI